MKTHGMTLILLCIELYVCTLYGQTEGGEYPRLRARVLFPLSGSKVDTCFRDNGRNVREIQTRLRQITSDSTCVIDSILFTGGASPEGREMWNKELAIQRVQALCTHLIQHENIPLEKTKIIAKDYDWNKLQQMVRQSSMRGRREILSILDAGMGTEWLMYSLMTCGKGRRWEYMREHFFPELRMAAVEIYWHKKETTTSAEDLSSDKDIALPVPPPMESTLLMGEDNYRKTARFALKTNLLYLGAAIPNVEGEYFFNDRWSGSLEYQYAWWHKRPAFFYRLAAGSPEVRYWFSKKDFFHGHFVGAYVGGGLYEFMFKRSFGLQGEFYIAGGVSYGYTMPIGKRLRMEFSLGIGYLTTNYRQYYYDADCYVYQQTKRYTYIGPTKAKVSLVLPLSFSRRKRLPGR